jgi:hypothetical protein
MSPAFPTIVVASEPASRKPIIDAGTRANLSAMEVLVIASWSPHNLIRVVHTRHDVFGRNTSRCTCTRSWAALAWVARRLVPPTSRTLRTRVRAFPASCWPLQCADCGPHPGVVAFCVGPESFECVPTAAELVCRMLFAIAIRAPLSDTLGGYFGAVRGGRNMS